MRRIEKSSKKRLTVGDRRNNYPSSRGRVVNGLTADKACKTFVLPTPAPLWRRFNTPPCRPHTRTPDTQNRYPAALEMTRHFFQRDQKGRLEASFDEQIGVAQRRRLDRSCDQGRLTPAVVDQMAGEYDTVDEFLEALEGLPGVLRRQLERRRRGYGYV